MAVLSVYVLPPQPPAPEPIKADTGPEMISGIEVATTPACTAAVPTPEPEILAAVELSGPAFSVNAIPFDSEPETPLVAVVLDDTAPNPALQELLFSIGVPLTVGVIAGGGGDRETASAARAAGFEAVAQLPLARQGQSGGSGLEYGLPEAESAARTLILMQRLCRWRWRRRAR